MSKKSCFTFEMQPVCTLVLTWKIKLIGTMEKYIFLDLQTNPQPLSKLRHVKFTVRHPKRLCSGMGFYAKSKCLYKNYFKCGFNQKKSETRFLGPAIFEERAKQFFLTPPVLSSQTVWPMRLLWLKTLDGQERRAVKISIFFVINFESLAMPLLRKVELE